MTSFDTQVHPEEMSFDKLTPEERIEFETIHDEANIEELEPVEEFWTTQINLRKGS